MKEERIEFESGNQPSEGLEPTDGAFDDPAFAITSEWSPILRSVADAALTMRADQLDVALSKSRPQGITFGGAIVDQSAGNVGRDSLIQERLNELRFRRARAVDVDRQRQTGAVGFSRSSGEAASPRNRNSFLQNVVSRMQATATEFEILQQVVDECFQAAACSCLTPSLKVIP